MEEVKKEMLSDSGKSSKDETGKDTPTEDEARMAGITKKVKNRKRKKTLHAAIRNQMEFYFSDANLSKDRFMQSTVQEGDVPLEVFMNFNKIRTLTDSVTELAKALRFSTLLKLNEDETKVSRITKFRPKAQDEVDKCTIYVEHLPPHASIEWLTDLFSEFGTVAYISLPKFKDALRIKGFAFVEFTDPESTTKAVQAYAASNAYSMLLEDPGQLCSIQSFNEENLEEFSQRKKKNFVKPTFEAEENNSEPKTKKQKLDEEEDTEEHPNLPMENNITSSEADSAQQQVDISKAIPKKRKHSNILEEIKREAMALPLQVMSKKDWKRLRNKYLTMQRKCVRQIRMNARQQRIIDNRSSFPVETKEEIKNDIIEKSESLQSEFQPGLIIKITLDEPLSDAKRFKNQVKSQDGIEYVEAKEYSTEAFLRCNDSTVAKSLVDQNIWTKAEILQGDDEKEYWRKIEEERFKKRDKSLRPKKSGAERARQKKTVIDADQPGYPTRAVQHKNLHIRFDESE